MNVDKDKKGYFEQNGRIRCVKFRGHKSEGLYIPLSSLDFIETVSNKKLEKLKVNDIFDELNGVNICKKYIIQVTPPKSEGNDNKKNKKLQKKHESKLIENQFRLHGDTSMLFRNLHKIRPTSIIHITRKLHGTSLVSSKILCKKPLSLFEKILKKCGVNIIDTTYDFVHSSRKVIKNSELAPDATHYYTEDIWTIANDRIKYALQDGMTLYGEIVGFTSNGSYIQKDFDYKEESGKFSVYIYRITHTNASGKVHEFTGRQVKQYCDANGLKSVPEVYYGYAGDLIGQDSCNMSDRDFQEKLLEVIKSKWNEHDCILCDNPVPEEGVVVRLEDQLYIDAYKCKSTRFLEYETKQIDKGEADIENQE